MVFSFFKKPPEKMVARPAAVPRSTKIPDPLPAPGIADVAEDLAPGSLSASSAPAADAPASLDSADFVFSESSPDFQIEGDIDPVDAQAEEAAILFANGQDEAVRRVLENAVSIHRAGPGERLWLMLFDVYQMSGKKAPFEALEIEYAQSFEKSPPGWRDKFRAQSKAIELAASILLFRGDLTGDNGAAFDDLRQSLEKNPRLRLDLSKVARLDAQGCSRLLSLLQQARKARHELDLLGRDSLADLLEARIECGRAEDQGCWLLFLELCQLQGRFEAFEEAAINYAVTFEVSPPSWEPRVAVPEALLPMVEAKPGDDAAGAYALRGDIKASRFIDLPAHAKAHDPLLIDCATLTRIDFISAGALLNVLTTIRRSGKQIVFRHPNHLVAELFGIVGLKAVATIVPEKY
jgi:anti-anti-sigma regulatory factor